jgi:hypothetical protein
MHRSKRGAFAGLIKIDARAAVKAHWITRFCAAGLAYIADRRKADAS